MNSLIEKYNNWTKNPQNGEDLFFYGFVLFIFRGIMGTTMFPYIGIIFKISFGIAILLLIAKIILFDRYTFKMLIAVTGMFICGAAVFLSSGYFSPFLWVLLIVAAKDVPFNKILKVYLLMNITIMGLAFVASLLGIIENLAYVNEEWDSYRYSFGCVYTTDFAAHIFFMLLAAFYLCQKRLRWYHYAGTCAIAGFIYYFCFAKLDTICILLIVLFFGVYHVLQWQSRRESVVVPGMEKDSQQVFVFKRVKAYLKWKGLWMKSALFSMPVLAMLMYFLSDYYEKDNEFLETINKTITGRLAFGKTGLDDYGISLFGQDIPMVGFGGSTILKEEYFFIDSSYINILLRYGIIFLLMIFIIYGTICYKHKGDTALMMAIVLLAVSCFIDHHIMEEAYNPLTYALFAKTGDVMWRSS
ncbi:MAG: hypothetical protein HFH68_02740 [Lachnospiraceae bacterium]|nr:hypothetical protein [Lachnospiraceae bacterium]